MFKELRIRFQGIDSASLCSLAGRYVKKGCVCVVLARQAGNRSLGSSKGLQIRAQYKKIFYCIIFAVLVGLVRYKRIFSLMAETVSLDPRYSYTGRMTVIGYKTISILLKRASKDIRISWWIQGGIIFAASPVNESWKSDQYLHLFVRLLRKFLCVFLKINN